MVVISLRLPLVHCGELVTCRHQIRGYKHATLIPLRVGVGPLLRTTMVSSNFQCIKCSQRLVYLSALPVQPSNRQLMEVAICGKATRYSFFVRRFNGCGIFLSCTYRPCCIYRSEVMSCTVNYAPHSPHTNIQR